MHSSKLIKVDPEKIVEAIDPAKGYGVVSRAETGPYGEQRPTRCILKKNEADYGSMEAWRY